MKKYVFIFLFLCAASARGDEAEVYDFQTGQYHNFDVQCRGKI